MDFESDPAKSTANQAKHGIDFLEAQALWSDPDRLEVPARTTNEPRFLVIGQIAQAMWTATVTYRHENTIRLISVRRARRDEEKAYREDDFRLNPSTPSRTPAPTSRRTWTGRRRAGPGARCSA